ncbi:MAG: helix-turn-helix domain-containing protein [Bacilli bacterium]|nr:helix-turn-helix domain-containing protein [Bacilli bacterium]
MHCQTLDAYFYMAAHGNKEAYQKLYAEVKRRAEVTVSITLSQISNLTGNPIDFSDFIDTLFFKMINEYDNDRGSFSNYVDYTFSHRLTSKVQYDGIEYANLIAAFNSSFDDSNTIESFADPNQKIISEEIAVTNFKARISSPDRTKTIYNRTVDRILAMHYLGFSIKEICETLKLSLSQYRSYIKKIKEEDRVINFKLEMK